MRNKIVGLSVAALLAASATARAVYAANMKPVYAQIKSALASGNTVQRATAVRQIAAVLRQGTHYDCPTRLRYTWLPLLMAHKDYPAVAKLARLEILLNPGQTSKTGKFQEFRVQALLAMGKNQAALRNAKSFFDVCTMPRTAQAVLLLAKCLNARGPNIQPMPTRIAADLAANKSAIAADTNSQTTGLTGPYPQWCRWQPVVRRRSMPLAAWKI